MSEVLADVELPMVTATVEQRIGDGNGGPVVAYRLVMDNGRAHVEPVPTDAGRTADGSDGTYAAAGQQPKKPRGGRGNKWSAGSGPDEVGAGGAGGLVVMSQSRETAEAVRCGELGALAALQAGLIQVRGDVRLLIAASEALALVNIALGQALTSQDSASNGPNDPDESGIRG